MAAYDRGDDVTIHRLIALELLCAPFMPDEVVNRTGQTPRLFRRGVEMQHVKDGLCLPLNPSAREIADLETVLQILSQEKARKLEMDGSG